MDARERPYSARSLDKAAEQRSSERHCSTRSAKQRNDARAIVTTLLARKSSKATLEQASLLFTMELLCLLGRAATLAGVALLA
ncbi:hypothetical protein ACJRO7_018930 [Eucalyptus globulus]|uniref:Uncharacterized protein n=1 Tax=Eucalyptus globulus TaxID=34317 RepID=A0ABD3KWG3_EUCGL